MKAKGMGDTVDIITTATGIKRVVRVISSITGKDCGCKKRRERWNDPSLLVNKVIYNAK